MDSFKFSLDEIVTLVDSEETGRVIGLAKYLQNENGYLVRYKAADGRLCECWWSESAIKRS